VGRAGENSPRCGGWPTTLLAEIVDIHICSGGTYGSPQVHVLRRRGVQVSRNQSSG
jgi:hypothetical protein